MAWQQPENVAILYTIIEKKFYSRKIFEPNSDCTEKSQ